MGAFGTGVAYERGGLGESVTYCVRELYVPEEILNLAVQLGAADAEEPYAAAKLLLDFTVGNILPRMTFSMISGTDRIVVGRILSSA